MAYGAKMVLDSIVRNVVQLTLSLEWNHPLTPKDLKRFWNKVQKKGPLQCWEWQAAKDKNGYGRFGLNGKPGYAHKVAYQIQNGPIPEGLHVLHTCDNPSCCNGVHLFLGTNIDNIRDAAAKGRKAKRLTWEKARYVREQRDLGETTVAIALETGIAQPTVSGIDRGKLWGSE